MENYESSPKQLSAIKNRSKVFSLSISSRNHAESRMSKYMSKGASTRDQTVKSPVMSPTSYDDVKIMIVDDEEIE